MKLVRVATPSGPRAGVLDGERVMALDGDPADGRVGGAVLGHLPDLTLLPPCDPRTIIGAGRNYSDYLEAAGVTASDEPILYMRSPNAIIGPDEAVQRPPGIELLKYEAELAVVMGRTSRGLTESTWSDHVLGYTCANDLLVGDWHAPDRQWVFAKSSDTLCPLGPCIETEIADPQDLAVRARVNGQLTQDGHTRNMVFGIGELLIAITRNITLQPGDVILTGTPDGAGPVAGGDVVEIDIEGIGTLRNPVRQM